MKSLITLSVLTLLSATPSHALVRELVSCTTPNNQYTINVTDNQGIGPIRTSHIVASIHDASGTVVASYQVEAFRGMSISFGRSGYNDTASKGKSFNIAGPSTNFRHYSIQAQTNVGGNSFEIKSDDLTCSIFMGSIINK